MRNVRILIVHPTPSSQTLLRSMLFTAGGRIEEAASDREAVRLLERNEPDVVVAAADPTDPDALEFLEYMRRKHLNIPVILLFPAPHPERTRDAMQRGAAAVLRFPLPATELRAAVSQAVERPLESCSAASTVHSLPMAVPIGAPIPGNGKSSSNGSFSAGKSGDSHMLVGNDPGLRHALELALAIAPMRTPVLIVGERGTGKSMLARVIHQRGNRHDGPFIEISCGGLSAHSLERELFGQSNGGFIDRSSKLSQAYGGTLFINDFTALTPDLQLKLLRVIHEQEFEAPSSPQTARRNLRLILGCVDDPASLVAQGRLRQDLFDQISTVCLKLPPLRQRGADLELLAEHFKNRFRSTLGKDVCGFTPEAASLLREHSWPGNVRELESAVERGVVVCRNSWITPANLALSTEERQAARLRNHPLRPHVDVGIRPLKEALEEPEKQLILRALESLNWNRQETARVLDINRTTLYKKMKKYGLLNHEPAWLS
jgi:DNA-binding NtrC family response regulator